MSKPVHPVLMLNSDLSPIKMPMQTLDFDQAFRRVISDNCYVVLSYDRDIKTANPDGLDKYNLRKWPSVIARRKYLRRAINPACTRHSVYVRDLGICQYCGTRVYEDDKSATMEHYIPRAKGGTSTWENLLLSCFSCNSGKMDSLPVGRWKPLKVPHRPDYWELVSKELQLPVTIRDERWLQFLPQWKGEVTIKSPF